MTKKLIVIGGVAAGTKIAAKVRRENEGMIIKVFTQDEHISYAGCGLPYYIGDDIKEKQGLLVKTPEDFKLQFNIDVFIRHKVSHINVETKQVTIVNLETNEEFTENFDKLAIATGASPFVPPVEGKNLKNVYNLRNVNDAVAIKDLIDRGKVARVAIIGGGLIGMETAEAFIHRGVEVTVIELSDQILGPIDRELAELAEQHASQKGVKIITGDGVKKLIGDHAGNVCKVVTSQTEIDVDLVLMSIGVRPNTAIAQQAGLEIGETGAIKVNNTMQTSYPDIYSAGDCVESMHLVTGKPTWLPLGSVANKQGRVAALNIAGKTAEFPGVLGSLIVKIFDLNVAKTGLSEKEAKKFGYDYEVVTIKGNDKAGYYPGCKHITIKLIADKQSEKLLGCQIIGEGIVDKRIDVVAMALTAGMTIDTFMDLDLAYAPPYSAAIDVLLVAATKLYEKIYTSKNISA